MQELADLRAQVQITSSTSEVQPQLRKKDRAILSEVLLNLQSFKHSLKSLDFSHEIEEMNQAFTGDLMKLIKRIEALHRQNSKLNERLQAERQQSSETIKALQQQLAQQLQQKPDPILPPTYQSTISDNPPGPEQFRSMKLALKSRPRAVKETDELDLEALLGAPSIKKP
mmetsp:Transcript_11473/g.22538  ORF Transcript_11473/g.22538 Transcript_11473/m.22538 type:complete len:170 (+) Transcript_11473:440-949(+)